MEKRTVEGYVEHIIFRNEENGYTVLNLKMKGAELTCVGNLPAVAEGELIEATGEEIQHSVYGRQFRIEVCRTKVPEDSAALERYLGSGAIRGVGAALAGRIVRHFREETLRIIREEPERLSEVKGISERKAREIAAQVAEKSEMQNAMIFLSQYGISLALGAKIYHQYGDGLYRILKENPYKLAEDIQGVGFKLADEIAQKIGIVADSGYRIRSALLYILSQASAQGHMYLPEEQLADRARHLLGIPVEDMEKYLMDLSIDRKIVVKEPQDGAGQRFVYAGQSYYLELNCARMLHELNIVCEENREGIGKRLSQIEKNTGTLLDEIQREAVIEAACSGLMILTGGPGTGKTTTINAMIQYFASEGLDIYLAAPTGRAAKRMTETTGYEACTIHRLLELNGAVEEDSPNVRFERNASNPLEADVVIIDEVSMVDIHLMHALLCALVPGTRLILVGDQNQLPSVGPGSVLRDLIGSGCFPVVKLTRIFRQATQSDIVVNAHRIHNGEKVTLDNKSRDFFFLKRYDVNVIQHVIVTLIAKKLPGYVDARPQDIQVLTPMRKGALGVESLNVLLQQYLNPPAPEKEEKENGSGVFREGDKVMQIRNNYQLEWEIRGINCVTAERGMGVFNGDLGIIRKINPYAELVTVEYEEGRFADYTFKQTEELELAYATTIHKAQGSEYPAVILPLLGGPRMLMTRNLLYTAVTRARKCVTLVGSEVTFQAMIENHIEENRYTTLAERIKECNQKEKE